MKTNSNLEFRKIKSLQFLYEVNENGTIFRNVKSKKQLKIKLDFHHSKKGYYNTFVNIKGKCIRVMIHKVVAECWLGDKPEGFEIDHIDRNPHNNHYSNLRYVTHSEQMKNRVLSDRIIQQATSNCKKWIEYISKPVRVIGNGEVLDFKSMSAASEHLATVYGKSQDHIRSKMKARRKRIYDYDIIYLNAETGHGGSTEQGTVHKNVYLVGGTEKWNNGKKSELKDRVSHMSGEKMLKGKDI